MTTVQGIMFVVISHQAEQRHPDHVSGNFSALLYSCVLSCGNQLKDRGRKRGERERGHNLYASYVN